jgi:hypothetical protein
MDNINQKLYELESSFYHLEARQYGSVTSSFGRPKRQIGIALLGGALIGGLVTSLYNSFTQASLADILKEKTDLISARVASNLVNINQNAKDIYRINSTLVHINAAISAQVVRDKQIDLVIMGMMIHNVLTMLDNRIERLQQGLDHVFIGKFHRDLVSAMELQSAMKQVKTSAGKKGLLVGATTLAEMYQLPSSFAYDRNSNILTVVCHIPLFRESHLLSLYRYVPTPIPLPWDQEMYFTLTPTEIYLGRNKDNTLTKSLTETDLMDCTSIGHTAFCDDNSLQKKGNAGCLDAIMDGITPSIIAECPGHLSNKMSTFVRINKNTYLVAESKPLRVISECPDPNGGVHSYAVDVPPGSHFLTVDSTCVTTSDNWVISPVTSVEDVRIRSLTVPNRLEAADFLGNLPLPDIRAIAATIKEIGQPIPLSHVKGLMTFTKAMERENLKYSWAHSLWVATTVVVVILAVGCLIYCCCGKQVSTCCGHRQQEPIVIYAKEQPSFMDRIRKKKRPESNEPISRSSRQVGTDPAGTDVEMEDVSDILLTSRSRMAPVRPSSSLSASGFTPIC